MANNRNRNMTMKQRRLRRQKWLASLALAAVLIAACTLVTYKLTTHYFAQAYTEQEGTAGETPAVSEPSGQPETSAPAQEDGARQSTPETGQPQGGYPALLSQSGKYTSYSGTNQIRVDNQAFDLCGYDQATAAAYAKLVSTAADRLAGQTRVYSLPIPTAYGITLPDDIRQQLPAYIDQSKSIQSIFSNMSSNVVQANCYDNLMRHRDEYLYFRTDHHWNGLGAYYAYEAFCQAKGIAPYTLDQREKVTFDGFLGTLYRGNGKDPLLLPADTVCAYKPHSTSATMVYYDQDGTATKWPIISDVSQWAASSKYSTFAGGDHPLTVFQNPEVTDGSVCIVVKDSFGNALLPYLVDHYSTIHEIDFRYWKGDLVAYAQEQGATDLIFANNVMTISTGLLVGSLSNIISAG